MKISTMSDGYSSRKMLASHFEGEKAEKNKKENARTM